MHKISQDARTVVSARIENTANHLSAYPECSSIVAEKKPIPAHRVEASKAIYSGAGHTSANGESNTGMTAENAGVMSYSIIRDDHSPCREGLGNLASERLTIVLNVGDGTEPQHHSARWADLLRLTPLPKTFHDGDQRITFQPTYTRKHSGYP